MSNDIHWLATRLGEAVHKVKPALKGRSANRVLMHCMYQQQAWSSYPWVFEREYLPTLGIDVPHWVWGEDLWGPNPVGDDWLYRIDEDRFKTKLAGTSYPSGCELIVDLEGPTDTDEIGRGWTCWRYVYQRPDLFRPDIMEKFLAVGELIRRERPDVKWGWWDGVSCGVDTWAFGKHLPTWRSITEKMKPLGQQADFLIPIHYQVGPDAIDPKGGYVVEYRDLTVQCEIIQRKLGILAEMHPGKPRYLMLHSQWYDRHTRNLPDIDIDAHAFRALLHAAYYGGLSDRGRFGVSLWAGQPRPGNVPGTPGCVYQQWDETRDWFVVLKELLDREGITPKKRIDL